MSKRTWRHGTITGYRQHQDEGERPCDPCYQAKSEYDKNWRATTGQGRKNRLRARAQHKATTRLRHLYPELYRKLYAEELERQLEAEEAPEQPPT